MKLQVVVVRSICAMLINFCAWKANAEAPVYELLRTIKFEADESFSIGESAAEKPGWTTYPAAGIDRITATGVGSGNALQVGGVAGVAGTGFGVSMPILQGQVLNTSRQFRYSADISVVVTNTNQRDMFWFDFYTATSEYLFSIGFDSMTATVYYLLNDDETYIVQSAPFDVSRKYRLEIYIDLAKNLWGATLDNQSVVRSAPVSTNNLNLNVGFVDIFWQIRNEKGRNNFLLVDNIKFEAVPVFVPLHAQYGTLLYRAGFETEEGFNPGPLNGQNGWTNQTEMETFIRTPAETALGLWDIEDRKGMGNQVQLGAYTNPIVPGPFQLVQLVSKALPVSRPIVDHNVIEISLIVSISYYEISENSFAVRFRDATGQLLVSVILKPSEQNFLFSEGVQGPLPTTKAFYDVTYYSVKVQFDFVAKNYSVLINDKLLAGFPRTLGTLDRSKGIGWVDFVWATGLVLGDTTDYALFDNLEVRGWKNPGTYDHGLGLLSAAGDGTLVYGVGRKGMAYAIESTLDFTNWYSIANIIISNEVFEIRRPNRTNEFLRISEVPE